MRSLLSLLLVAATARAAVLSLYAPRVTTFDSTGAGIRTENIKTPEPVKIPLTLGATDSLKLTFTVVKEDTTDGVQPLQTFLRFYDRVSGEEGIQPLRVTPSGKSKFELNMAKPLPSIPPTTTEPLEVTIIIGHPDHSPLKLHLFDLILPASGSLPQHPDEASFHLLPTIHHTFRLPPKTPPQFISAVFAALTLAPWLVLSALWSQVFPGVPHLFSPRILPFIATLGAFEVLLVYYWVGLKLGQVLLYGSVLGLVTVFTGNTALSSIGARRVGISSK
ncbi:Dolichyl-diphosphooligosaccharide--protein glycosyltransferase subunit 2 [Mycena indigotica]|uniref:Dolichyl-diphosphooligosaccharide--protein glycosyltransferase subunit 2 n=1 Tax=Mycena indigotica TaxID=2126181 RepID=A0A8H6W5P4_9AGAR|nr:Dolichyl-diphosphooligosaccharide--protein glycosyltransferase subunit 2 [Mycena indigotica]KAF7306749.1 Dolichyl-diphosphooligosaccharide--protein glycosyltransferase subunit 2 [Mycena indigotica]